MPCFGDAMLRYAIHLITCSNLVAMKRKASLKRHARKNENGCCRALAFSFSEAVVRQQGGVFRFACWNCSSLSKPSAQLVLA